jgi:hypothetical protein
MESLPLNIRAAVVVLGATAVVMLTLGRRRKRTSTGLGLWAPAATPQRAKSGTFSQVH